MRHRLLLTVLLLAALSFHLPAADSTQASPAFDRISKAATQARTENRISDAIGIYRQALKLRPAWPEGWWFLGELLYDQDQYAQARDALRRLIDLDRKSGPGFALLGLCEFETKDYAKSLQHIFEARRLGLGDDPDVNRVVLFHEALLLIRTGQFEPAERVLEKVLKDGGEGQSVTIAAGLAGLRRPIFPEELPPADQDLVELAGRAFCASILRSPEEAQKSFAELLAKYPSAPNVHYFYASFISATDRDAGLREFLRETELNPKHAPALASVALEYEARGEPDKAIAYARRAVEADPSYFAAHAVLGKLLTDAGEPEKGIKELEIARQQAADSPQVHFSLAAAYAMAGRKADAERERAEFVRLKQWVDDTSK